MFKGNSLDNGEVKHSDEIMHTEEGSEPMENVSPTRNRPAKRIMAWILKGDPCPAVYK